MEWSTVARYTYNTYKNRHLIQKYWQKLQVFLGTGKTDIVIFGRPEVGKSVLCSHLNDESISMNYKLPDTSTNVEIEAVPIGEWTKIISVVPGQNTRERTLALAKIFETPDAPDGIIYVVDWGYTEPRNNTVALRMIENDKIGTIEELRLYNLKNELEDFKKSLELIVDSYIKNKRPKWLVIAVNKVDLFYGEINEAQKYYCLEFDSEFTKLLKSAINRIGELNIKCKVLPISSYQSDLKWNGKIIRTDIGGIENARGLTLNFIKEISDLKN